MQFIHISVGFSHSEDFTDMVLNSNDSIIIATHENFKKQTLFGNIGAWYQSENCLLMQVFSFKSLLLLSKNRIR